MTHPVSRRSVNGDLLATYLVVVWITVDGSGTKQGELSTKCNVNQDDEDLHSLVTSCRDTDNKLAVAVDGTTSDVADEIEPGTWRRSTAMLVSELRLTAWATHLHRSRASEAQQQHRRRWWQRRQGRRMRQY